MAKALLELNHWGHPFTEAVITDLVLISVVPSLDEALIGSTNEGSVELWVRKDCIWVDFALNLLLWDLSLDWEEIEWSHHLVFMMLMMSVMSMTMVFMALNLITFTMVAMSVMFMVFFEHIHEMWVSGGAGNTEKSDESKLVHFKFN